MLMLKQKSSGFSTHKVQPYSRLSPNISAAAESRVAGSLRHRAPAVAWQRSRSQPLFLFPPVYSNEKVIKENTAEH